MCHALSGVATDPQTPTTLYAGTDLDGVFKSADGSGSWTAVDIGLTSTGHGPLSSLIQAFSPATLASGLASRLNRTLFGTDAATHRQNALPPPVPVAARAPVGPQPPRLS